MHLKKDDLKYKLKRGKTQTFGKYSLPIAFLKDMNEGYLSLENADFKQSNFPIGLKNFEKKHKNILKMSFLNYYSVKAKKFLIALKADYL